MDDVQRNLQDEQLRELAIAAQGHPQKSRDRQEALTRLVEAIRQSGRLRRPRLSQFAECYEDIYDEALQELMLYICKNIEKYDPKRGPVLRWVNYLMEKRFFVEAIATVLGDKDSPEIYVDDVESLNNLEEETPFLSDMIRDCLEEDPDNLFKNKYVENHPKANFQILAKYRWEGRKWKEISAEFRVSVSTLSSFYERGLKEFAPIFKLYLSNEPSE